MAEDKHLLYLGLRLPNGRTDTTYPDLINAISEYTDDLAFFSVTLCEDLMAHGKRIADESKQSVPSQETPACEQR